MRFLIRVFDGDVFLLLSTCPQCARRYRYMSRMACVSADGVFICASCGHRMPLTRDELRCVRDPEAYYHPFSVPTC